MISEELDLSTSEVEHTGDILQLVSFKLGSEEFGVEILSVQEIIRIIDITEVPNAPHFVEGVINLRGKVLPVVNLRSRLGFPEKEFDKSTRIIVVEMDGKNVGFIVDSVSEVLRIPTSLTEPPPDMVGRVEAEYITAVGKLEDRLVIMLELSRILAKQEQMVML